LRCFDKPAIDISAQLSLLKQRGLEIQDESKAHCFLEAVSFFRLTPYMRPFQLSEDAEHGFKPETSPRALTGLYDFDRKLRLLVIDAIERIEVAARAAISNHMGPKYGAHWYLKTELFQRDYRHQSLLENIARKQNDARRDHERECQRTEASHASDTRKEPWDFPQGGETMLFGGHVNNFAISNKYSTPIHSLKRRKHSPS
jgi:abortive infection bacteriophage resistance protein